MNKTQFLPLLLVTFFLGLTSIAYAQTTINAASHTAIINGATYDYSIGEMTLVTTERNNNLIVTQGYLQPQSKVNTNDGQVVQSNLDNLSDQIKVYPNPTENLLFIETNDAIADQVVFQLLDATGRIVLRKNEEQAIGSNKYALNLSALAAGSYYLILQRATKNSQENTLSFKIQKLH
jgi:Secretion system C-terminal sorting domain